MVPRVWEVLLNEECITGQPNVINAEDGCVLTEIWAPLE